MNGNMTVVELEGRQGGGVHWIKTEPPCPFCLPQLAPCPFKLNILKHTQKLTLLIRNGTAFTISKLLSIKKGVNLYILKRVIVSPWVSLSVTLLLLHVPESCQSHFCYCTYRNPVSHTSVIARTGILSVTLLLLHVPESCQSHFCYCTYRNPVSHTSVIARTGILSVTLLLLQVPESCQSHFCYCTYRNPV